MDSHDGRSAVSKSQETSHGAGHDYTAGSPHLRHAALRERIDRQIRDAVAETLARQPDCDVLEIGAGHGSFTETVVDAGGSPTITEMSKPSFEHLSQRFRDVPRVRVLFDTDGTAPLRDGATYDVILMISVIHHIPDYVEAITTLCDEVLNPGGAIITFQDPLWYPRRPRHGRWASWGSYFAWRITQGEIRRGLRTRWRRFRGTFDDLEPSDLVEYHVVRDGVDEVALRELLQPRFTTVEIDEYFSTQLPLLQRVGGKYFPPNTFGIAGYGHVKTAGDGGRLG